MKRLKLKFPVWLRAKALVFAGSLLVIPSIGHVVIDAEAIEPDAEVEAQLLTPAVTAVEVLAPAAPPTAPTASTAPTAPIAAIDADAILAIANQLADSHQYLNAITLLQTIPADHSHSNAAIAEISSLEQRVLEYARSQYDKGNHDQAFTTLAIIPASSGIHLDAKNLLSEWIKEQHQKQFALGS